MANCVQNLAPKSPPKRLDLNLLNVIKGLAGLGTCNCGTVNLAKTEATTAQMTNKNTQSWMSSLPSQQPIHHFQPLIHAKEARNLALSHPSHMRIGPQTVSTWPTEITQTVANSILFGANTMQQGGWFHTGWGYFNTKIELHFEANAVGTNNLSGFSSKKAGANTSQRKGEVVSKH